MLPILFLVRAIDIHTCVSISVGLFRIMVPQPFRDRCHEAPSLFANGIPSASVQEKNRKNKWKKLQDRSENFNVEYIRNETVCIKIFPKDW